MKYLIPIKDMSKRLLRRTVLIGSMIFAAAHADADGWLGDVILKSDVKDHVYPSAMNLSVRPDFNVAGTLIKAPVENEMAEEVEETFLMPASMSVAVPQQIVNKVDALAAALENDPVRIYEYVRNHIAYDHQLGWLRSAERTLVDGSGSAPDQAVLLVELLRAAGYTNAGYASGWVSLPFDGNDGYNISNWLGAVDLDEAYWLMKSIDNMFEIDEESELVAFYHDWVTVSIDGQDYELDPSIKPCRTVAPKDIADWSGYSRGALLSEAGGTTNANSAWNLNEAALRTNLTGLAAGLISSLQTNAPNADVTDVLGGHSIVSERGMGAPRFSTLTSVAYTDEMTAPSPYIKFINGAGGSWLISAPDLGTDPLSLDIYQWWGYYWADIYVDEVYQDDIRLYYDGTNQPFAMVDVVRPAYEWVEDGESGEWQGYGKHDPQSYDIPFFSRIAVPFSFGNSSGEGMLRLRTEELNTAIELGANQYVVTRAALHVVGASWLNQRNTAVRTAACLFGQDVIIQDRYCGGMLFKTEDTWEHPEGFSVDIPHQWQSWIYRSEEADATAAYRAPMFLASALEHGVLEQTQPEAEAVSTIRLLTQASRSAQQVFRVTSDNWSTVLSGISGYSPEDIQNLNDLVNAQQMNVILPESGQIGINSWTGSTYIATASNSIAFMISPEPTVELDGGYSTTFEPFNPYAALYSVETAAKIYDPGNIAHAASIEPVDLVTGSYLFDHDDLTMAGPLPLTLSRHYNSGSTDQTTSMGAGWMHSFDMRAEEQSDIQTRLRSPEDAAAVMVGLIVIKDLLEHEDTAKGWLTEALTAQWVMDQLTGHTVSIVLGQKAYTFTEQPDGSYTPPPGMTVSLTKTNGVFVMQERNAEAYTFNTNNLIAEIRDPDDNTLTFAYNAQTNLQSVTSSFGPVFTFGYTSGLLTSVSDNSSPARTVYYQYDANNNLTNFVDAAGSSWGIAYSDANHPNAITSLTDPEEITTIQNFYNSLGIVTQQVSATSNPWNFYIAGFESVEEDPLGNRTLYEFDEKGRTLSVLDAQSNRTTRVYDGQNHVTNIVDAAGVINIFVYDQHHNLLKQTAAAGTPEQVVTAYGYDAQHHLRFVTNALGSAEQTVTEYTYTGTHHVDTITEAKGTTEERTTDYNYNSDGLVEQVSEGDGQRVTTYSNFDSHGNAQTVNSTDAGTISRTFNARGDLETLTVDGKTAAFGYNALRLPTAVTNALGTADQTVTSKSYYDNGLLKTSTDARSKITRYFWTPAYKPAGVIYPDTGNTTNLYDEADRLFAVRDAKGSWATNTLDSVGRPVFVSSVYSSVSNQYNSAGNVTNSAVDPDGLNLWSRSEYDNLNRLKNQQTAIGTQQFFYDLLGRTTNLIDQASKHWKTEYDALSRVKKTFRPSENFEEYSFDALGNRTRFWNADRNSITFGVDAQGRVTSVTNAIDQITHFSYDDAGNLIQRSDASDQATDYAYDSLNRLMSVTNEGVWKASFDHDPNGNITLISNPVSRISMGYDDMNRLTSSTQSVYSVSSVVQNSFDLNGNRTNILYPGGLEVSYTFGADNRLESVTTKYTNDTKTISFGYDTANRMNSMTYPNSVNSTFGLDAEGRVTNIVHGTFVDRTIQRNALGFKTSELIDVGIKPTVANTARRIKTHNAADQLTQERIQTAVTNWTTVDYTYNDNGGLDTVMPANEASTSYSYDYDNRLETVSGGSQILDVEYLYDASGARIGRVENAVTNYFIVDYADGLKRPLAETDASGNITRYYVWSGSRLLCHIEADGTTRYYHADELGSTLSLTDELGNVTDEFAYMPYGYATHSGTNSTPFQWLGGYGVYYDTDTDLHLTLHRAYSSSMKRFISMDPTGIDAFPNLYAYGDLNPTYFVDPEGLWVWHAIGAAVGAGLDIGAQMWIEGKSFDEVSWVSVGASATSGAMGVGLGNAAARIVGRTALKGATAVAARATINAAGSAGIGATSRATQNIIGGNPVGEGVVGTAVWSGSFGGAGSIVGDVVPTVGNLITGRTQSSPAAQVFLTERAAFDSAWRTGLKNPNPLAVGLGNVSGQAIANTPRYNFEGTSRPSK